MPPGTPELPRSSGAPARRCAVVAASRAPGNSTARTCHRRKDRRTAACRRSACVKRSTTDSASSGKPMLHCFSSAERSVRHRLVGGLDSGVHLAALELQLRLERPRARRGQLELDRRDDLARALAFAHVADTVLARIAPVLIELGRNLVRRHDPSGRRPSSCIGFADALDEGA